PESTATNAVTYTTPWGTIGSADERMVKTRVNGLPRSDHRRALFPAIPVNFIHPRRGCPHN
ncbi:hypothetical protein, partial [Mesorhizobium sp.]|uniref:hypothetical protein n=1 Tax=Mesorhizobium sp. TaxID=1871066 RepID=UPI00257ADACF